jgi:Tfp pilus assembly protein PilX
VNCRCQRGAALLLGLVLLAAVSLLALTAANGMVLQRRMAANFNDDRRALDNAAIAEASARAWLLSRADSEREHGCQAGCVLPVGVHGPGELPPDPEFEHAAWWRSRGVPGGSHPESGAPFGPGGDGADPPLWLIEEIRYVSAAPPVAGASFGAVGYYRILARGSGAHAGSVAVTETLVARPWEGDYVPASLPPLESSGQFCRQFDAAADCGTMAWRQRR